MSYLDWVMIIGLAGGVILAAVAFAGATGVWQRKFGREVDRLMLFVHVRALVVFYLAWIAAISVEFLGLS